jgi:hypothetical protein
MNLIPFIEAASARAPQLPLRPTCADSAPSSPVGDRETSIPFHLIRHPTHDFLKNSQFRRYRK